MSKMTVKRIRKQLTESLFQEETKSNRQGESGEEQREEEITVASDDRHPKCIKQLI